MSAADFYTGIVVDAYGKLKSIDYDPEPYADFVTRQGQPGLELGCGDGTPLLSLRARGLDVDGVDSSTDMLDGCYRNAAALGIEVTLFHQRMQDLALPRLYRSIYLAGPTFNLLPDDETAVQALRAIRKHLTSDGAAMIPLWIPERSGDLGVSRAADGLRFTPISEIYDESARTRTTTMVYEKGAERLEREWILHWHTVSQFRALCDEAGLRIASLVDDDGAPAGEAATDFTATVKR